ncbi:uncharacterized protein N7506_003125 [Penicillium brevicompactum]|nr:uncharacterized protein N7506_003125 [Penicillium brevicompactum]KAJ5343301.1 hypothetical protein N7506_003125 [Penicillium brevicompactum]
MGPKACDHCSQEKCTDESCARCSRLKSFCPTSRRDKRIKHRLAIQASSSGGRPACNMQSEQRRSSDSSDSYASSLSQRSDSQSLHNATEQTLTPESTSSMVLSPERPLASPTTLQTTSDALRTVMNVEQFSVIHLPFMLGSSFIPDSQKTIYVILRLSAPTLTEGYLAFLGLMTTYQKSLVLRRSEPDMVKAAKGLQRLRGIKIQHDYDAACALFLGQTMYVFNVLTAPYSNTAHTIVRSALMSTKRWLPRLIEAPIMDTITMSPIIIDTVECIFHREIPIIRLYPQRRIIVDRYVGLCATLLSHFYDICECSHALKTTTFESGSEELSAIWERLDDIEDDIRRWRAQTPPQLFEKYGKHAVLAMVTQANVYRLAGLLVIHRLRYPLGVEDEQAQKFANNIFAELAFFAKSASKEASALPVVFPLTVAMFEVEGPGEDLLDRLASFTVQSVSATRLQDFVRIVRHSKLSHFKGVWFDLVDTHLHVAAPP